jgi:hypothetical protein
MSILLGIAYKCEGCGSTVINEKPWICPICEEETCRECYYVFGVCSDCCKMLGFDEKEIKKLLGIDSP